MPRVHHSRTWPRLWLFTDERLGDQLWAILNTLPQGSGVIFRHDRHPQRAAFAHRAAAIARRRGLLLVVAGAPVPGLAAPRHARAPYRTPGAFTASVHSVPQAVAAVRSGARLLFASPLHPTRSHPGGRTLPRAAFAAIARAAPVPVVALGGMNAARFRALRPLGAYGFAAIDAFLGSPASARFTSTASSHVRSVSPVRAITSPALGTT